MTEAEIIKTLERACLYQTTDVRTYKGIPIEEFSQAVLALINRKNAEIERLENLTIETASENAYFYTQIKYANTEIERLKDKYSIVYASKAMVQSDARAEAIKEFADIGKMYSEIKAEAIKEFAERLKRRLVESGRSLSYWEKKIDQIAKEMGAEV